MTSRKLPAANKAVRKHLQRSAPAPAVVLSPAAAWPFPPRDAKLVAPPQDVAIEDQRAIAKEQRKAAKKAKKK